LSASVADPENTLYRPYGAEAGARVLLVPFRFSLRELFHLSSPGCACACRATYKHPAAGPEQRKRDLQRGDLKGTWRALTRAGQDAAYAWSGGDRRHAPDCA
jgi:hypothetical protein